MIITVYQRETIALPAPVEQYHDSKLTERKMKYRLCLGGGVEMIVSAGTVVY